MESPELSKQYIDSKEVITVHGSKIGLLKNIIVDVDSGQIEEIIVRSQNTDRTFSYQQDEQNDYIIPSELITAVDDNLVVEHR